MDSKTAIKQLNALRKKGSNMRLAAEEWKNNFQTLIAIVLSARTRDETTIKVCKNLFLKYPTAEKLSLAKLGQIEKLIRSVNFYRNKSKNILNCSKVLAKTYKSKVPETIDELIKLPGVGRKTANVYLAEHKKDNIGVDTHLNYISNYLKWTENKNPHKIEKDLENLFPRRCWRKINPIAVRFGKTYTSKREKNKLLNEIKKIK